MDLDIQNNNDKMNSVYNNEDCVNSDNQNPYIGNEQTDLLEMNENISKETVDCDNFSNQTEATLVDETLHVEDDAQKASTAEIPVHSDEPIVEDKNETGQMEENNSDSKTAVSFKDKWFNVGKLHKRHVKRYLDEPSDQMVIFSSRAYNSIISETFAKNPVETGGILLGYVLDNGFWIVTEVIPPGKSSVNEYAYFEYDTDFVNYVANRVAHQFKYPPQVLGLWHRHPGSLDTFSSVDDSTNATFSNNNRAYGAISALVNVDPKFRITIYHAAINEYRQVQYQKMAYEVGDELIPDEYFQLKYVAGTSKSHAVQEAKDADAPNEALHNCIAEQESKTVALQNQEKDDSNTLKRIHITLELILILFLSINIAIFIQNQLINPLTDQQPAVQLTQPQYEQQLVDLTSDPWSNQQSVAQPTFSHFDQQSAVLPTYSLTSQQSAIQLTQPQYDTQAVVLQAYTLPDQRASVKDWASLIKECINFMRLLNERVQITTHNYNELSMDSFQDQPIQDSNNAQANRRSDEAEFIEDVNADYTLDKEENNAMQSHRNGYSAIESDSALDCNDQELIHEKNRSVPDAEPQNWDSGLLIKTAHVPSANFE